MQTAEEKLSETMSFLQHCLEEGTEAQRGAGSCDGRGGWQGTRAPCLGRQQRALGGSHIQTVRSSLLAGYPCSPQAWHAVGAQATLKGVSMAEQLHGSCLLPGHAVPRRSVKAGVQPDLASGQCHPTPPTQLLLRLRDDRKKCAGPTSPGSHVGGVHGGMPALPTPSVQMVVSREASPCHLQGPLQSRSQGG